jgi:hypothetical protein
MLEEIKVVLLQKVAAAERPLSSPLDIGNSLADKSRFCDFCTRKAAVEHRLRAR